jgi:GT2 family glycosyltransferase
MVWASWEGPKKHAANVQDGFDAYLSKFGVIPPYFQILDRDIILGRNAIDKLLMTLSRTKEDIGYAYCSFEYKGFVNAKFPPAPFDIKTLMIRNYISSNSMYKTDAVRKVGFVTEEKYHRLSDWAMWLKMYRVGYSGILCPNTSFIAVSAEGDISAGSNDEYVSTKRLIMEDFVEPVKRM